MQDQSISVLLVGVPPTSCPAPIRSLLAHKGKGLEIDAVCKVAQVLSRIEKRAVDVVLFWHDVSDSLLEVVDQVNSLYQSPAIVIIADEADEKQVNNAMRAGAQDFLDRREISNGTLPRVVAHAAQRRQAEQTRVLKKAGVPAEITSRAGLDRLLALDEQLQSEDMPDGGP